MNTATDTTGMKLLTRSAVFPTLRQCFEYAKPFLENPLLYVDINHMPGVGSRATVYEKEKS